MVNFLELDLEAHRLILEQLNGSDLNNIAATCTYLRQCTLSGIFADRLWRQRCAELLDAGVVALHAGAAPPGTDLALYWRHVWQHATELTSVRWWQDGARQIKHNVDEADARVADELRAATQASAEAAAADNEDGLGAARKAAVLADAEESEERVRQLLRAKLARSGHTATLCGACVLVTGGILRDGSPDMDVLTVHLDTLQVARPDVLGNVPATRFRHTTCLVNVAPGSKLEEQVVAGLGPDRRLADGTTVVLFGGYNTLGQEFGGLEALWVSEDAKLVVWTSLTSTGDHPAPRFHHSCEPYKGGNALVVYAGEGEAVDDSTDTHAPAVYLLDLTTLHWTRKATFSPTPAENPGARSLHLSSTRVNPATGHEELIVFGGYTQNLLMKMFVFTLDLATFWWQRSTALPPGADYPLPQPRQRSACYKLTPTWLLVFGGSPNQGDFLSDVHKLHIPSLTWEQPVAVHGKGSKSTRRIAGHSVTGLLAFGGCVPTIMGIMPVPKADILLLGPDMVRTGQPPSQERQPAPSSAQQASSHAAAGSSSAGPSHSGAAALPLGAPTSAIDSHPAGTAGPSGASSSGALGLAASSPMALSFQSSRRMPDPHQASSGQPSHSRQSAPAQTSQVHLGLHAHSLASENFERNSAPPQLMGRLPYPEGRTAHEAGPSQVMSQPQQPPQALVSPESVAGHASHAAPGTSDAPALSSHGSSMPQPVAPAPSVVNSGAPGQASGLNRRAVPTAAPVTHLASAQHAQHAAVLGSGGQPSTIPGQMWRDPASGHLYFQPAPASTPQEHERMRASTLEFLQQIGVPNLAVGHAQRPQHAQSVQWASRTAPEPPPSAVISEGDGGGMSDSGSEWSSGEQDDSMPGPQRPACLLQ